MALIKCKECGQQISDKATTCPHCGAPVEKRPPLTPEQLRKKQKEDKHATIVATIFLAIIVGLVIFIIGGIIYSLHPGELIDSLGVKSEGNGTVTFSGADENKLNSWGDDVLGFWGFSKN